MVASRLLRVTRLNALPAAYFPILQLQELLFEQRRKGLIPDTLLQLQVGGTHAARSKKEHRRCWLAQPINAGHTVPS